MTILIGVDEAGYGPNLGPLAVAATAWRVGDGAATQASITKPTTTQRSANPTDERAAASTPAADHSAPRCPADRDPPPPDLYALLSSAVAATPDPAAQATDHERLAIADSKTLYKPRGSWRLLERGVLAAWAILSENGRRFSERIDHGALKAADLIAALGADPLDARSEQPWRRGDDVPVPRDATAAEVTTAAKLLAGACNSAGVELLAVRARLVYPAEFNDLVDQYGTKGAALSHVTLALVRSVIDESLASGDQGTNAPQVQITCDKHGGRNRYAPLLQHHFPDSWIDIVVEGRRASRYAWLHADAVCEACFRVGGEAELPAALASMTAKYLRELAMHQFNAFWTARMPDLKPTAGYPVDARRFKTEIADELQRLKIPEHAIWRSR